MTAPALETVALTVGYRRRRRRTPVFTGLNLTVAAGELVCLVGPNGVGKTTLFRTLSGGLRPIAGVVRLGGRDIAMLRQFELARVLAVVTTDRMEVSALRAYQVAALGRYPHTGWGGRLSAEDHAAIRWALRAVGADHLADRDVSELSDGERQRINIARALAQRPSILILDEPTAFLDLPSRIELMALLRDLARDEGVAVIVSTHDLDLALRTADQLWVMTRAKELFTGAPEDLVFAGRLGEAFSTGRIRFDAGERGFRLTADPARPAVVHGEGIAAALAAAALEREGLQLVATAEDSPALVVTIEAGGRWQAEIGGITRLGAGFAALARLARDFRPDPSGRAAPQHTNTFPKEKTHG
jgi:iron complex transport system ATP-binding protein